MPLCRVVIRATRHEDNNQCYDKMEINEKSCKTTLIGINAILVLTSLVGLLICNGANNHLTSYHLINNALQIERFDTLETVMTVLSAMMLFVCLLGFLAAMALHTFFLVVYFVVVLFLIFGQVTACCLMQIWFHHQTCGQRPCFTDNTIVLSVQVPFQVGALVCCSHLYQSIQQSTSHPPRTPRTTQPSLKSYRSHATYTMPSFDHLFLENERRLQGKPKIKTQLDTSCQMSKVPAMYPPITKSELSASDFALQGDLEVNRP